MEGTKASPARRILGPDQPAAAGRFGSLPSVHPPRPPAVSPGTQAFLWAVGLGGFIFVGMLSISISMGTSIVTAIVCGIVIYFAVRLLGAAATPARRSAPRR